MGKSFQNEATAKLCRHLQTLDLSILIQLAEKPLNLYCSDCVEQGKPLANHVSITEYIEKLFFSLSPYSLGSVYYALMSHATTTPATTLSTSRNIQRSFTPDQPCIFDAFAEKQIPEWKYRRIPQHGLKHSDRS